MVWQEKDYHKMDFSKQKKRDFPNYLAPKTSTELPETTEMTPPINEGTQHYLPFDRHTPTAYHESQRMSQLAAETYDFPSFKKRSQRGNRQEKWRAFLNDSSVKKPFTPSVVPSILKGLPRNALLQKQTDYEQLEIQLRQPAEEMLVFATEEVSLVDTPAISEEKEAVSRRSKAQKHFFANQTTKAEWAPLLPQSVEVIQETLLQSKAIDSQTTAKMNESSKQRRAMKRSLSWIMEQEQQVDSLLPYHKQ